MIELFIENRKIDLQDDLEINFTYESIDADKLSSIKNSFSKTVNIPGTANNNITFGHIWRFDRYLSTNTLLNIGEGYDPHKKVNWYINKNGSLINSGYCTLDNIVVRNERDITYQMTFYGGIGEFFYSLSYVTENDTNSLGNVGDTKTLADLFWDWKPKRVVIGYGLPMTPEQENTETIMKCSAEIVANSYHNLNPYNNYEGTTEIDKDIVFVPCYTGLYENFDSKHMIVSTFNQNYYTITPYMSATNKTKLQTSFPDSYTEDGKTYTTLDKTFNPTGAYKYGLVEFPREVDPWEAGDLRVNELPVAIRLSKLMTVISQPGNNGGYEVEWDDEIKNSWYWLYGWTMIGKLKQEPEKLKLLTFEKNPTYDGQQTSIDVEIENFTGEGTSLTSATPYNLVEDVTLDAENYNFSLNVFPKITFSTAYYENLSHYYDTIISGCMQDKPSSYRYVWTTPVLVHKIYDGNTLIKTIADIFYFSSKPEVYYFGYNNRGVQLNDLKNALNGMINMRFMEHGEFIDEYRYHNCKLETPTKSENSQFALTELAFQCSNEQIRTNLTLESDTTQLKVEQLQGVMWTNLSNTTSITAGKYGTDEITFDFHSDMYPSPGTVRESPFGFVENERMTLFGLLAYNWGLLPNYNSAYSSFTLNEARQNGFLVAKESGFNITNLDKKTLFANSQTPMKYLSDFCKLMNYRFICDNTSKTIHIKTLRNYYVNKIIDISDRVDYGRDIGIKTITTKYGTINFGLETPETYPVTLFNRISHNKFNINRYDTGFHYHLPETNLLDNLIYKNTIDWQQSSIYYNNNPQIPKPYNTQSVSWTLFNVDSSNIENIEKKQIFTVGLPSDNNSLFAATDFLPKISLFDKNNKAVDFGASLIFLNGFVKNYDYTTLIPETPTALQPDSTNPTHYINSSGIVSSSQYQDIYIYNVLPDTTYYVTASYGSSYSSYTVNYYNASGTRIGTEYPQSNANLVDAVLTLPTGTTTIRCNFRKADTNAVLKAVSPYYVISPRISLSNDMYEQYYFNQDRCYVYDFKYNDVFTSWGCYSAEQKGSASSWVLPMFSRDLYNIYVPDVNSWNNTIYKFASWNLINQEGLDNQYSLSNTRFIYNTNYDYLKLANSADYLTNEYTIDFIPADAEDTERIFDKNWKDYLGDLYDRNTRDITAYVDLSGFGDANQIMRYIYAWKSHLWIIKKIENFKISETTHDKFTRVTLHKINDMHTWTD